MSITLTSTGKIIHEDFSGGSLPLTLTAVGNGSLSYADETLIIDGDPNQYQYVVTTDLLPALPHVIRVKSKISLFGSERYPAQGGHVADSASRPNAAVDHMIGECGWICGQHTGNDYCVYAGSFISNQAPYLTAPGATYYVWEQRWDTGAGRVYVARRNPTTLATDKTADTAYSYANNRYLLVGCASTFSQSNGMQPITVDYIQVFTSLNITVTGLDSGNACRLYTAADDLVASGVEAGGTATLDATLVNFPLDGYINVYVDDSYAELVDTESFAEIFGGDEYEFIVPPVISGISPNPAFQSSLMTVSGTGFGAAQGSSTVTVEAIEITVESWSDTEITFYLPSGLETGTITIAITTVGGSDSSDITYSGIEVSSATPDTGRQGDQVTLAGNGFGTTEGTVTFYNGLVAEIVSWADTEIVVIVPIGAETGNITVTVGGETGTVAFTVVTPQVTGFSSHRVHIGDTLEIYGEAFSDTQGEMWITVEGVEAEVTSWTDTLITITIPEPSIDINGWVPIQIGHPGYEYEFTDSLWILLGGILRFVEPNAWDTIRLDLDSGGEGYDQEIWQQQGTKVPLPASSPVYSVPDLIDGEELVVSRLPNKEVTLNLLFTAISKAELDELFAQFEREIYRYSNCLEYRPEGSSKSIYYTTFRVVDAPEMSDYFSHKSRRVEGAYAYDVQVRLPCLPYAEMAEEEVPICANKFPNGSFERVTGDDFENYEETVTGSATVTADADNYVSPGGISCKLTTTDTGEVAQVKDLDFIQVDASKIHTLQLFAMKHSGTIKLTSTLYCFDENGDATTPASIALMTDVSPSDTSKWHDVMLLSGEAIIYAEGDVSRVPVFPPDTTQVKLEVKQVGSATEVAAVSIDALLLSESNYISDYLCEASMGIVIPPGVFKGDLPAPLDVYISGSLGASIWAARNMGILQTLYGLDYVDTTHAYAVGADGKILFNDGNDWVAQSSGVTNILRSVSYIDGSHIWAVGDNGTIRLYGGAAWAADAFPTLAQKITDGGLETWTSSTNLTNWTEGYGGSPESWSITRNSTYKKSGSYCARLYTIGPHYDRGTGSITAYAYIRSAFASINKQAYNISWALRKEVLGWVPVGTVAESPKVRVVAHFYTAGSVFISSLQIGSHTVSKSSSYTTYSYALPASSIPSNAARMKIEVRVGVTGSDGVTGCYVDEIYMYEQKPVLYGVAALDANHVIAVGQYGQTLFKHNAGAWAETASGVSTLYSLRGCCIIAGHAWAVGDNGTIIHSTDDGATWAAQSSGVPDNLHGVFALDATHVWAVGEGGTILFYDGTSWSEQVSPTAYTLRSVGGYLDGGTYYVWACGDSGRIIERGPTTGTWVEQGSGTPKTLYSIGAVGTDVVMAVGADGTYVTGKSASTALYLTNLILGQRKEYHADYNPVLDAVTTGEGSLVELYTRRKQKYRAMKGSAGDNEEWLFNVAKHKGLYLLSVGGAINNAVNFDQIDIELELQDASGEALTPTTVPTEPASLDLSVASGATCVGEYFREVAMLGKYPNRFKETAIPSSFVSPKANLLNINQAVRLTAPVGMDAADRLYIDCLSLIPVDRAFVEVNNWRSGGISGAQQSHMIISSSDKKVLSSLYGTLESAMVHNPSYWNGAPGFEADPLGVNMTLVMSMITGTTTTTEYQFIPRPGVTFKYKPRVLLAGV